MFWIPCCLIQSESDTTIPLAWDPSQGLLLSKRWREVIIASWNLFYFNQGTIQVERGWRTSQLAMESIGLQNCRTWPSHWSVTDITLSHLLQCFCRHTAWILTLAVGHREGVSFKCVIGPFVSRKLARYWENPYRFSNLDNNGPLFKMNGFHSKRIRQIYNWGSKLQHEPYLHTCPSLHH